MRALRLGKVLCCASFIAALSAVAPAARADDVAKAKALFNAGAQAYAKGRFATAIESFKEAYGHAPRPEILFSLAQSYRRQYVVDNKPESLQQAIASFKLYLQQVPDGGRRADATAALGELTVMAKSAPVEVRMDAPPAPLAAPVNEKRTRISVTSPTPGAFVSLDGGKPTAVPLVEEIKPGKHSIKISAEGYIDEARDVAVLEGDYFALDRELRQRTARLELKGPAGAQVAIDGRFVGTTPLPVLDIEPGAHFVGVTKNGFKPFSRELTLGRGRRVPLELNLSRTPQRITSYFFFGAGILTGLGSLAPAVNALDEQEKGKKLQEKREKEGLTNAEVSAYNTSIAMRDERRTMAFIVLGTGFAFAVTGFLFYSFDQPSQPLPPQRSDEKQPASPARKTMEIAAGPVVTPEFAGMSLVGKF